MERLLQAALAFRENILAGFLRSKPSIASFIWGSIFVSYCFIHYFAGGLNFTHISYSFLIIFLYFAHKTSRTLILLIVPIILHNMIFDAFRYIPFENLLPIHVLEPYQIDQLFFSIQDQGKKVLLYDYLSKYSHPILDLLGGVFYNILDLVTLLTVILCWRANSIDLAKRYCAAFLLMNLFAFLTYYFYPTAAPWYVLQYGFAEPISPTLGNAAGLHKFDQLIGINISSNFYQMNPVVFGAVPSMHAGFTMLGVLYSFFLKKHWSFVFIGYAFLTCFLALYLKHHYVIDILLGILYALTSFFLIEKIFTQFVRKIYNRLYRHLYF